MSNVKPVNLGQKLRLFSDDWAPRIVGQFSGHDLMLAKVKGAFVSPAHPETDDVFYVIKGRLDIEMWDHTVTLMDGEMGVVPAGIEHRPVAREETHLLVIEPAGMPNEGNANTAAAKPWI